MDCNGLRVLTVLVVGFSVVVAVLVGVLIWREKSRPEERDTSYTSSVATRHYPGYFRTRDEQSGFAQRYLDGFYTNRAIVNETFRIPNASEFCGFYSCGSFKRKKRQSPLQNLYHGCCQSSILFISPPELENIVGTTRTLVHFDDLRQYFVQHECKMDPGCGGCTCSQENTLYSAVVVKSGITTPDYIEDTEIDFFYIDGCCKCVNT